MRKRGNNISLKLLLQYRSHSPGHKHIMKELGWYKKKTFAIRSFRSIAINPKAPNLFPGVLVLEQPFADEIISHSKGTNSSRPEADKLPR